MSQAIDWYEHRRASEEQERAIADSGRLVAAALMGTETCAAHGSFCERIIGILERPVGLGSFKTKVQLENGREVTYSFSWAVGMGHRDTLHAYDRMHGKVPPWVLRRHPYQILCLCRLALDEGLPLPDLPDELFSPPQAAMLRKLRQETSECLTRAIQGAQNRSWLMALSDELARMHGYRDAKEIEPDS